MGRGVITGVTIVGAAYVLAYPLESGVLASVEIGAEVGPTVGVPDDCAQPYGEGYPQT